MKKIKLLFCLLLTFSLAVSCQKNTSNKNLDLVQSSKLTKVEMSYILFGEETSREGTLPLLVDYRVRTESDVVNADGGCYTVNVRVSIDNVHTGESYQVANDNVQVSDCPNQNRTTTAENCNGTLPNGDQVLENGTIDNFCLYEVLTRNSDFYNQYLESVNELIN